MSIIPEPFQQVRASKPVSMTNAWLFAIFVVLSSIAIMLSCSLPDIMSYLLTANDQINEIKQDVRELKERP